MAERLTFEGNFCEIARCKETRWGKHCPDGACSQRKVWERLKEYEDALSADVAPVVHGRWEYDEPTINTYGMVKCTVCNWWSIDPYVSIVYHYCPNCGARMAEDIDEQKK